MAREKKEVPIEVLRRKGVVYLRRKVGLLELKLKRRK